MVGKVSTPLRTAGFDACGAARASPLPASGARSAAGAGAPQGPRGGPGGGRVRGRAGAEGSAGPRGWVGPVEPVGSPAGAPGPAAIRSLVVYRPDPSHREAGAHQPLGIVGVLDQRDDEHLVVV